MLAGTHSILRTALRGLVAGIIWADADHWERESPTRRAESGAGLADPEYRQTSGSVRLTLPTDPVERELAQRLPSEARVVARLLRDSGRLGTGEIIEGTGRSRPWVLAQLRSLEEAGVIERVGKGPTDPRAFWRLRVD